MVAMAACSDKPLVSPPARLARQDIAALVTPAVASSLDKDGRFQVTPSTTGGQYPELSLDQANKLATVWGGEFAPLFRRRLEKDHGAAINYHALTVCGRTLYARSAFQSVPSSIPEPYRRPYGPWYLATLCGEDGSPTISLAISAWATDLAIVNGRIKFPSYAGNEFFSMGIPQGHVGEFPTSPEAAASLAAQTGRRVSSVPELVMQPNLNGPPQLAHWHISLDGPASVQGLRSGAVNTSELYIGLLQSHHEGLAQFIVPSGTAQPASLPVRWSPPMEPGERWDAYANRIKSQIFTSDVPRRTDTPVQFDAVSSVGGK